MDAADDMEDEDPKAKGPKNKKKKFSKKKGRILEKADFKNDKDYELFLRDLEEDPELRANINLYKDDDIIAQLEAKMGGMTLEPTSTIKVGG